MHSVVSDAPTVRSRFPWLAAAALTIAVLFSPASGQAQEAKRVALVIGINEYPKLKTVRDPSNGQLARAVADAETMSETLKSLNFDVEIGRNVDRVGFLTALDRIKRKIAPGDTVFVFFAGHGVAFKGSNLLLPSDIPPVDPEGEQLIRGLAVAETDIIDAVREKGAGLTIVTLDACRDNPIEEFAREQARIQGRAYRSTTMRSVGLEARPTSGVFSIYSAGIGQKALDRLQKDADDERNSVFTRVFAKKLREPGRHLSDVMEDVKDDVARLAASMIDPDTRQPHRQFPAFYNETQGGRIFIAGRVADAEPRQATVANPGANEPAPLQDRKIAVVAPPAGETKPVPLEQTRPQTQPPSGSLPTLDTVQRRGALRCGVSTGLLGFSWPDEKAEWTGLDVGFCRALAAAIFDNPAKVQFVSLSAKDRFTALQSGEVDVLARATTKTSGREISLGLRFGAVNYYDGQGLMVRKTLHVKSARELRGANICVQVGTTTELTITDYMRQNKIKFQAVQFATEDETIKAYDSGRCDAITNYASALYRHRKEFQHPGDHIILPERLTRELLAPVVRQGDDQWLNIVTWTHNAMVAAEELGISRNNLAAMKRSSNPDVRRLLGGEGSVGESLGLSRDWAARIVDHVGNYGELFERSFGKASGLDVDRGQNRLIINGGLQQSPSLR